VKIAYINSTSSGVDYHRLTNPLSYLDHEVTAYNTIPLDKVDEVECDVLIFSRCMHEEEQLEIIKKFRVRGTKVICDVDDYWGLPQSHPAYHAYKENDIAEKMVDAMRYSSQVWTTHTKLAEKIKQLGQNRIRIYPNALDPTDEQWLPNKLPSKTFRIGFTGGITHEQDLYETADAWKIAHTDHDIEAVMCGVDERAYEIYAKYQYIMSGGGRGKVRAIAKMNVHNYGLLYDQMDVSIAPLYPNNFNQYKSNLKVIESGMKATPIICSWMHPYVDDAPGIYRTDNWRKAFAKIMRKSPKQLQEQGEQLREYVIKNYDIRNHKREV
jgi:hypothetical protein